MKWLGLIATWFLLLPSLLHAAAPSRSTFTQPFGFWSAQTNDTDFGVAVRAVVPAGLSTNFITTQASNGVVVAAGNNVTVGAAGAGGKMTYTVNGVGTNGFVDSSITNGLATTNYVNSVTNGLTGTFQWGSDLLSNLVNNPYHEYTNIGAFQATNANLTSWALYSTNAISTTSSNAAQSIANSTSNALQTILVANDSTTSNGLVSLLVANDTTTSNALRTDLSNLQGATNGLQSMALAASNSVVVSSNALRTDLSNLQGATNGLQALALAASNSVVVTSNALRTDIGNLQGGTNGLNTRVGNLEGSSNLTAYALVSSTTFLTNWGNAVSNYVTAATNSASVTNWINARQPADAKLSNLVGLASTVFTNVPLGGTNTSVRTTGGTNFIDTTGELNNWSQIPTGAMANVVSASFLTNWANAISNSVVANDTTTSNALNTAIIAATNSASVTNWINFRQAASALLTNLASNPYTGYTNLAMQVAANNVLSNVQGMASFYWTNGQASSMVLSNIVGMASFYWTNSQASSMVLSNIVGMASFYWTNGQASSMVLSNLVNNPYVSYTNALTKTSTTVSGAGSGNTNYLITLSTNAVNYFYLGSSNINIYTVGGSTLGSPILWTAIITNLSAINWGFGTSSGTNRWKWFNAAYGTNRPAVLTNNTALQLNGSCDGTNTLVSYQYYAPAL